MIKFDGYSFYSTWENSRAVRDLYRRRCRKEEVEMTAHAQAAEILSEISNPGETLLDVGCGSGYFFHAINDRSLGLTYLGIDASPSLINIGKTELPAYGLNEKSLVVSRIDQLRGAVDHVVCINVLSNIDNFHASLERILQLARKSVILRESLKDGAEYNWVKDNYLDSNIDLSVYVNHYDISEIIKFMHDRGFNARAVTDHRTNGSPEFIINHPHYWTFIVANRI